jgi:hypothetical protein
MFLPMSFDISLNTNMYVSNDSGVVAVVVMMMMIAVW